MIHYSLFLSALLLNTVANQLIAHAIQYHDEVSLSNVM